MHVRPLLIAAAAMAVLTALAPAAVRAAAVTSQEWNWITEAKAQEDQGNLDAAMPIWSDLVASLKTHNPEACGNYAKKLGRALDARGRTSEALAAFDTEFECWGPLSDPSFAESMLPDQHRAQELRPVIRAFVSRPTDGAPRPPLGKFEPAYGTMLGGTMGYDPAINGDPAKVPGVYGKPYAIALTYVQWNSFASAVTETPTLKQAPAFQVSWEPTDGLAAVQDGTYMRAFARELKSFGRPVFLRFASEMNGSWTSWYGNPALYREKFALVARVMREEAPNVAMVWSPNFVADGSADEYYPGDDVVDWVGINGYTEAGGPNDNAKDLVVNFSGKSQNPLDKFQALYAEYAPRKPIMISETGFGWANRYPYVDETAWAAQAMERFYGYLPLVYPRIKAVSLFQVDVKAHPQVPTTSHYVVSGNAKLLETYKRMTAPDWYLGDPKQTAAGFWRPMEQSTLSGPTRVAAYVNLVGGVSRVAYRLDGVELASATQLPWAANLDLSGLTGAHTLTIVAYGPDGRPGFQRDYPFDASAIRIQLNGSYLDFDQPPVIQDGRTLVPARAILEALGATVTWDAPNQKVVATGDGSVLQLQIGNPVPVKDGKPLAALDVPAQIIGGRTLVPARFVAETLHMNVTWDAATRTVIITRRM